MQQANRHSKRTAGPLARGLKSRTPAHADSHEGPLARGLARLRVLVGLCRLGADEHVNNMYVQTHAYYVSQGNQETSCVAAVVHLVFSCCSFPAVVAVASVVDALLSLVALLLLLLRMLHPLLLLVKFGKRSDRMSSTFCSRRFRLCRCRCGYCCCHFCYLVVTRLTMSKYIDHFACLGGKNNL